MHPKYIYGSPSESGFGLTLGITDVNKTQAFQIQHLLTLENVNKNMMEETVCLFKEKGNQKSLIRCEKFSSDFQGTCTRPSTH